MGCDKQHERMHVYYNIAEEVIPDDLYSENRCIDLANTIRQAIDDWIANAKSDEE